MDPNQRNPNVACLVFRDTLTRIQQDPHYSALTLETRDSIKRVIGDFPMGESPAGEQHEATTYLEEHKLKVAA